MDVIKAGARPLCPEEVCVGTPIVLASDNAGYELKHYVEQYLDACGVEWIDCNPEEGVAKHYPEWAHKAAQTIMEGKAKSGILICGTGIGISIAANKVKGIRAALCGDVFSAKATREHNDANILAMGARVIGPGLALEILKAFLETPFSDDERHIRRIKQIED